MSRKRNHFISTNGIPMILGREYCWEEVDVWAIEHDPQDKFYRVILYKSGELYEHTEISFFKELNKVAVLTPQNARADGGNSVFLYASTLEEAEDIVNLVLKGDTMLLPFPLHDLSTFHKGKETGKTVLL